MTRLIDADALRKYFESNSNLEQVNEWYVGTIIESIDNAPTIQREGWVSVPIEPTYQMCAKALVACPVFGLHINAMPHIYKAMIQAAPTDKE